MKRKSILFLLLVFACAFGLMTLSCSDNASDKGRLIAKEVANAIKDLETVDKDSAIIDLSSGANNVSITTSAPDSLQKYDINVYVTDDDKSFSMLDGDTVVAILAIALIFGTPIFIAIVICICIFKIRQNSNKVTLAAIEKGYTLPNEENSMPEYRLQSGIKMIAWAVGLSLFFIIVDAPSIAVLAVIPFIIGLGRLISYYLTRKKEKQNHAACIPPIPDEIEISKASKQEYPEGNDAL